MGVRDEKAYGGIEIVATSQMVLMGVGVGSSRQDTTKSTELLPIRWKLQSKLFIA